MSDKDPLLNGKASPRGSKELHTYFCESLRAIMKSLDSFDNQKKFVTSVLCGYIKTMEEHREEISELLPTLEPLDIGRFDNLLKCIREARVNLSEAIEELDDKDCHTKKYHKCLNKTVEIIEKHLLRK